VPLVLEAMLVREHRQHALQSLIGELDHPPTSLADQVLMAGLRSHGLVALESFSEVVGPHQPTLDEQLEGPIYRRRAHLLALVPQLTTDCFDGEMVIGQEDDLRDEVSGPCDGLVVFTKVTAEALGVGGGLCPIQSGHGR
jgi:hypothetical protein